MIFLYNLVWLLIAPFVLLHLMFRVVRGKEDILRLLERFGIPSKMKPHQGIIWIHAASVGESKIALTLEQKLRQTHHDHKILITTGTVTSARMIRKNLNGNLIHQFIPLDNYISIWLFFKYWRPKIGILIESELWPNLVHIGSKHCPMILANARVSDKSFARWSKYKGAAGLLINKFKAILCQGGLDYKKYQALGAKNAFIAGNLKYSASKLEVNAHNLKSLSKQLRARDVFLAASTHPGDDEYAIAAHIALRKTHPNLLTIIAPRHTNRAVDIQSLAEKQNLITHLRSQKTDIDKDTDIYIADTMGELGLFFSIAKATFMGGSFKQGGHNLIEPAYFPTIIIFGPNMSNCTEVAEEFLAHGAAYRMETQEELNEILERIYSGDILLDTSKTKLIIQNHTNIINNYLAHIDKLLGIRSQ